MTLPTRKSFVAGIVFFEPAARLALISRLFDADRLFIQVLLSTFTLGLYLVSLRTHMCTSPACCSRINHSLVLNLSANIFVPKGSRKAVGHTQCKVSISIQILTAASTFSTGLLMLLCIIGCFWSYCAIGFGCS